MDDPISALDANVKKKIFKKVFMKKFQGKTRVLVTHAVDFLEHVDTIIILKKGEIVLKGSYEELKDSPYLMEVMAIHKEGVNTTPSPKGDLKTTSIQNIQDSVSEEESLIEEEEASVKTEDIISAKADLKSG